LLSDITKQKSTIHFTDALVVENPKRGFELVNPNFRTPNTLLEPSTMGSLVGKQECNEKKVSCPCHAPSIYGGEFMGAGLLLAEIWTW
jgi:hypothetical protein